MLAILNHFFGRFCIWDRENPGEIEYWTEVILSIEEEKIQFERDVKRQIQIRSVRSLTLALDSGIIPPSFASYPLSSMP